MLPFAPSFPSKTVFSRFPPTKVPNRPFKLGFRVLFPLPKLYSFILVVTEMRNLQLSFNQTQKVRLEKALERLESLSSKSNPNSCVTVGDTIPVYEDGILK